MNVEQLIGLGAAPLIVWRLTQDIKSAVRYFAHQDFGDETPWPLLADALGALYAIALQQGGLLDLSPILAGLVGLSVGVAASKTYEVVRG